MGQRRPHPFELAQVWRLQLESDPKLNKAGIAAREGISRARVTQIMDLLELPEEIRNGLIRPPASLEIHSFPERRLRIMVGCGDQAAQMRGWQGLVQELVGSVGE